jgi:hypothetical protein
MPGSRLTGLPCPLLWVLVTVTLCSNPRGKEFAEGS